MESSSTDRYLIAMYVTFEQETAIRYLFTQRGWIFEKSEPFQSGFGTESIGAADLNEAAFYQLQLLEKRRALLQDCGETMGFTNNLPAVDVKPVVENLSQQQYPYYTLRGIGSQLGFPVAHKDSPAATAAKHVEDMQSDSDDVKSIDDEDLNSFRTEDKSGDGLNDTSGTKDSKRKSSGIRRNVKRKAVKKDTVTKSDEDSMLVPRTNDVTGLDNDLSKAESVDGCKAVKVEYVDDYDAETDVENYSETLTEIKSKEVKKKPVKKSKKKKVKSKKIYCSDCKRTFCNQQRYDIHLQRNNGKCYFVCEYCEKIFFFKKSKLDVHVRSAHTKERPFVCEICGKGYVTADKLKIHVRVHTGEKPCICDQCGKAFYSLGQLSIHKNYHHIWKHQLFKCEECNSTFNSKTYLSYHKKVVHCKTRDHHCPKCGKGFKSSDSLRYHLKFTHAEGKLYKCPHCEKCFKAPAGLRRHRSKNHTTVQRRFQCTTCGKAFAEKDKLKMHINVHTGEKPYKCNICDFRCAFSGNLSKHKKTHASRDRGQVISTLIGMSMLIEAEASRNETATTSSV